MADRPAHIRLGIFVVVALSTLAGLLIFFGGDPQFFSNQQHYIIEFTEAPGIAAGTPVRKSGVRVGQVEEVRLNSESNLVEVSVQLDPSYIPHLGEEPVISRGLLNGDTAIDFVPKSPVDGIEVARGEPIPVGSRIPGVPPINPRTLFNQAQGAIPNAQETLLRLTEAMARFQEAAPKAERAFDEIAALAKEGREFVPELRKTNQQLQSLIGSASSSISTQADPEPVTLRDLLKEAIDSLRALRPAATEIQKLVEENRPQIKTTLTSIQSLADSADKLLSPENRTQVKTTLTSIQTVADNTNKLVSPENVTSVTKSIKNIETASDDISKTIRLTAIILAQVDKTIATFNARLMDAEKTFANINKATEPFAENAPAIIANVKATSQTLAENAPMIVADVKTTAKNLAEGSTELSDTLKSFRLTLKQFNNGDGSLAKFLSDPAFYNKFAAAADALSATLARTTRIANDLEVFADKIARRPEILGVGGALTPSSGLKGSPVAPLPPERQPLPPLDPPIEGPPVMQPIAPVPFVPLQPIPRR